MAHAAVSLSRMSAVSGRRIDRIDGHGVAVATRRCSNTARSLGASCDRDRDSISKQ